MRGLFRIPAPLGAAEILSPHPGLDNRGTPAIPGLAGQEAGRQDLGYALSPLSGLASARRPSQPRHGLSPVGPAALKQPKSPRSSFGDQRVPGNRP